MNGAASLEHWWAEPAEHWLEKVGVDPERGLAEERVEEMRERYGANTMVDTEPATFRDLLWESLTSPMILLLLAVAGISLLLGQFAEAIVMAFVVLIYVGVELINKGRTDRTLARLRELQSPRVQCLRDGERREIAINDVVVGDILPLQPGSRVPADARLLQTVGLLVDEAALTGESRPLPKDADAEVNPGAPLAERPTAVFAGTTVVDGQGRAVVVAVGDGTELGHIAELSAAAQQMQTPLQQEMRDLAKTLAYVALVVSLLIPLFGWLRGFGFEEMVLTWLSLTFLMVPGQPPIIITMALALAALELARKDVIVSRLSGAETLGSVTTIVSDKTGTLTENAMSLTLVILPDGETLHRAEHEGDSRWHEFLKGALPAIPEDSKDPTDRAILDATSAADRFPRPDPGRLVSQVGFARRGSHRSLTYQRDGTRTRYVAGSPDFLLTHANQADWTEAAGDGGNAWPAQRRDAVREQVEALAAEGYRITAYGIGPGHETKGPEEGDVRFVGCAVLEDPVRQEVPAAIAALRRAGVRTLLVTGDNAATARHVARQIKLDNDRVITGQELEALDEEAWGKRVRDTGVFARATPEQKLRIVEALQSQGETVAVTGDGVNDAPALRTAHIGVAMGETGTDVAREAADLVLTDDNFAHLPDGVLIGRKAYDNFNKGITYYLSAKAILLVSFLIPLAVGQEFPFAPIQIIAIELLMDLASSTIFITEAAEPGLMEETPRKRSRFLSWDVGRRIVRNLIGPALAIMVAYFGSLALGHELQAARTAAFATWLLGHIVLAFNLKQRRLPLLRRGLLSNRFAVGWLAGMIGLVLAMTLVPAVRDVLNTTALSSSQWALVIGGALLGSMWMEALKWVQREDNSS
jgi:P-type Ca2+ transporter type 2C